MSGQMIVMRADGRSNCRRTKTEVPFSEIRSLLNDGYVEFVALRYEGKGAQMLVGEEGKYHAYPVVTHKD